MLMHALLNANDHGTPLVVIEKSAYNTWLTNQTSQCQTWLLNTEYSGNGLSLVRNSEGKLELALFVVADASDYFACGDLIKQLPTGQYLLKAEEQYVESISFGWLVGAYQFDRYITNKSDKKIRHISH
jgi:leucyl aminopeptidase